MHLRQGWARIELEYEMTYAETIDGPLGPTTGSPLGERFAAALTSGEATTFDDQYMRIVPQFEVGAGRYAWLSESLFLGRGRLTGPKAIAYEIYRVK